MLRSNFGLKMNFPSEMIWFRLKWMAFSATTEHIPSSEELGPP
jgi:hypothetical protein